MPGAKKNRLFSLAIFLERQEKLEDRAYIGQLLNSDLEFLDRIEQTLIELQKVIEDIKKLNNKRS